MSGEHRTGTVIVGGGQAGLALSRHLTDAGHPHVVLERGRIGERWRSQRWDSLRLLSPSWSNLLPGQEPGPDPGGFASAREFLESLERYAWSFLAPVVERTAVTGVSADDDGYVVGTERGRWRASSVVLATGDSDVPRLPLVAAAVPRGVTSLPAIRYRSPDRLPPGGVLVVGAGPTGQQIALELARAGRPVTLAVGRHARLPRRYRGHDIWDWLYRLGDFDVSIDDVVDPDAARRTPSAAVTGANGGEELDLRVLHDAGVDVRGRLVAVEGRSARFDDDLHAQVERSEMRMRRILLRVDELADRLGDDPEEIRGIELPEAPPVLDLRGVSAVVWATGYRRAYPWLHVPVLDASGEIVQRHGVTDAPGLYTLGLRFQRRRASHFIGGVGEDAAFLAERIVGGSGSARLAA